MKLYSPTIWVIIISIYLFSSINVFAQKNNIVAFENINVIDVKKGELIEGQNILIKEGLIIAVGEPGDLSIPEGAQKIDGTGKFILPGLIDGHTHLSANQNRENDLQAMLRSGITSVRDMGGNATVYKRLEQKSDSGEILIPDIYYSANLFGPEFMIDPRVKFAAGPHASGEAPWMRLIDENSIIEEVIDDAVEAGVTGVKLYSSLRPEQLLEITQAAKAKGLQVWGHGTIFPSKPSDFAKAGPDALSHALSLAFEIYKEVPEEFNDAIKNWIPQKDFSEIDENDDKFSELFKNFKSQNIIFEPTIHAWKKPEDSKVKKKSPINPNVAEAGKKVNRESILDWNDRITKKAIENNLKISAGTDQSVDMKWVQDEIIFLNDLGLSPLEAIKSATLTNAEVLGLANKKGSIEVGKDADLLILDKNPLTDINNIRSVKIVLKNGEIITDP